MTYGWVPSGGGGGGKKHILKYHHHLACRGAEKQREAIFQIFSEYFGNHHFMVLMPAMRYIWPALKPFIHAGSSVFPRVSFRGLIPYITTT